MSHFFNTTSAPYKLQRETAACVPPKRLRTLSSSIGIFQNPSFLCVRRKDGVENENGVMMEGEEGMIVGSVVSRVVEDGLRAKKNDFRFASSAPFAAAS